MPTGRGFGRRVGLWAVWLALVAAPVPARSAGEPDRFTLLFEAGPDFYRYEETGEREFAGLETEWADVALRVSEEARYRTPIDIVSLLRFSFLTSAEDTETNNVGSPPTEMRIAYFFTLQPGLQYELRPWSWLVVAPEFVWDLDWYLQVRETEDAGDVDESVFWQGPAPGLEAVWLVCERFGVGLGYRHSFLIDVDVSNSFAEGLGFGDFSTEGERDVVQLRALGRINRRWSTSIGYRFESDRIDASDTRRRTIVGPGGPQTVQIQFPRNDHTIHGVTFSLEARF
ncbi:MAG: hypothetical protein ACREQY_08765 [Candidatus Binatia bacterium]